MSFIETPRFPTNISYGSSGGPKYQTQVVVTRSGREYRNADWELPLHQYDVAWGIREWTDLEVLLQWFHAMEARTHEFRFKDPLDFNSTGVEETIGDTDQTIGTGDDTETEFQLIKNYTRGSQTFPRDITKPVTGTTVISFDDVSQGAGWAVDTTTGLVTFDSAPTVGVVIKAGFRFDVPVRFNTDELDNQLENYQAGTATVPLIEVRA